MVFQYYTINHFRELLESVSLRVIITHILHTSSLVTIKLSSHFKHTTTKLYKHIRITLVSFLKTNVTLHHILYHSSPPLAKGLMEYLISPTQFLPLTQEDNRWVVWLPPTGSSFLTMSVCSPWQQLCHTLTALHYVVWICHSIFLV